MGIQPVKWALRKVSVRRHFDRLVLLEFAEYANDDGTEAFPSAKTIAKELRCDLREVRRSIKALVEDGWMVEVESLKAQKIPKSRRPKCYRLMINKTREPIEGEYGFKADENGVEIPPNDHSSNMTDWHM